MAKWPILLLFWSAGIVEGNPYVAARADFPDMCQAIREAPPENPSCVDRGNRQSPIDIISSDAISAEFDDWYFENYCGNRDVICVFNTGHTVEWILANNAKGPAISGAGLKGKYFLEQVHIHWSTLGPEGSEHLMDGQHYPMEIHFVHYHERYNNVTEALGSLKPDAVAALAVFVNVTSRQTPNPALEQLLPDFDMIRMPHRLQRLSGNHDLHLLIPTTRSRFYRYEGSLTSGLYHETLIWTIFEEPLEMTRTQADAFHDLYDEMGERIRRNNRETQELNGRMVLKSKPSPRKETVQHNAGVGTCDSCSEEIPADTMGICDRILKKESEKSSIITGDEAVSKPIDINPEEGDMEEQSEIATALAIAPVTNEAKHPREQEQQTEHDIPGHLFMRKLKLQVPFSRNYASSGIVSGKRRRSFEFPQHPWVIHRDSNPSPGYNHFSPLCSPIGNGYIAFGNFESRKKCSSRFRKKYLGYHNKNYRYRRNSLLPSKPV